MRRYRLPLVSATIGAALYGGGNDFAYVLFAVALTSAMSHSAVSTGDS